MRRLPHTERRRHQRADRPDLDDVAPDVEKVLTAIETGPGQMPENVVGMGGCLWLTILGGVLEGFGFGLVAWELWRVQHSEFGPPAWLMRLRAWVRRLLRRPTVVKLGRASVSGGGSMKARMRVRRSPSETLEERVAALEANFGHLEGELDERTHLRGVAARICGVRAPAQGPSVCRASAPMPRGVLCVAA